MGLSHLFRRVHVVAGDFDELGVAALALVGGQRGEPRVAHGGAPLGHFVRAEPVVGDLVDPHHVLVGPVPHLLLVCF